jgi:UDP-N-acetylmuramate--alanine ligase
MVVEADESDGTFVKLPAAIAVVTNIDPEHLDFYGDFDSVRRAFLSFVQNIPFYGFAALCLDHPEVQALIPKLADRKIVTYGLSPQADVRAINVKLGPDGARFDVIVSERAAEGGAGAEGTINGLRLPMYGRHNVQNACAAIAVAREMGIEDTVIREALAAFAGVKRRFTKVGEVGGITVIDDYAHHPVEIAAVLRAAREAFAGKIIAVIQPHRFTRLRDLFEEFATCFNDADIVLVADVYPAGEQPIEGVDRDHLAAALTYHGHRAAVALPAADALAPMLAERAQAGDVVVCLGAGSITYWAQALPEALAAAQAKQSGGRR